MGMVFRVGPTLGGTRRQGKAYKKRDDMREEN